MILFAVRVLLPAAIAAGGVVLIIVGNENEITIGITLIGAALTVFLLNFFLRMSVSDTADREREEAARDYFGRHGRWPDED